MTALQTTKRIEWIDIAKAITIILVVFGHTLRGGMVQQIVYSFPVPVFFFLSGMTCKADNLKKRIINDFFGILLPYYIFGFISIIVFLFLGKFVADQFAMNVNTSLWNNLWGLLYACPIGGKMQFNLPLWFLPCMFAAKMVYYALYKLFRGKQFVIFGASVILFFLGVVYTRLAKPALPLHFSVALKMLVFFTTGQNFSLWLLTAKKYHIPKSKAFVLGGILLVVTVLIVLVSPKVQYAGDMFPDILSFLITALTGSFSICFISIGIGRCNVLEYVGKRTLAILVMHKFPVLLFQTMGPTKALLTQYNSPIGIVLSVFVSIIAILLCLVAERIIFRYFPFLLGDFSSFSKCK